MRDAKKRQARLEAAQRRKESENVREVQNETIKTLQWLMRHQNKASDEYKAKFKEVLSDIDIFAKSAADDMRWSDRHQATWRDLEQMYKDAQENDPNFLPSKEMEKIIARLNNRKVADMDMAALMDLYKAAIALKTEYKNRNDMLLDEKRRTFSEIYKGISEEMKTDKKQYSPNFVKKFFNNEQLTPMNMLEMMGGWNEDGTLYSLGKMLEQGEREVHAYIVKSGDILEDFLKKNNAWVRRADGQHKDSIWYTEEVRPYLGHKYNPETGRREAQYADKTVRVHMTPAMRVYLYLESLGTDNVRHMTAEGGGRTFPNRKLYSKGKRAEAFAQGTTVRLSPETIKQIADPSKFSSEEKQLFELMNKYFNEFSKGEINKTSNALHGYSKAMSGHYAQIFTNHNYTKVGFDHFGAPTAEGVGNMKERMKDAVNPTYCVGAFDAFERHVNATSKYVGLSIPVNNFKIALNWRENGNSAMDRITHKWGREGLEYIEKMLRDIQSANMEDKSSVDEFLSKLSSNYISAVFGLNPSIVFKQLGSMMTAATYLEWGNRFIKQKNRADYKAMGVKKREIIAKYTSELEYRTLGFSSEETKTLKDNPGWLDNNKITQFLLRGGAITWMDGRTAESLWRWAENKVRREHPELELGTKEEIIAGESEFLKAVAKEYDYVVSRTQSMSDFMHQSTLRRDKSPLARIFTLFRSDAAQNYNVHRQLIGEAIYLQKSGADKKEVAKAWNKVGRAVLNTALGYSWAFLINFLINLWKYKGKRYRDDEGELTAESIAWNWLEELVTNYAGIVAGGEELAGLIASVLMGEVRYDTEAIEMEQLNELFSELEKKSKLLIEICAEANKILDNDGDLGQYFSKKSGEILDGIKDVAKTMATYIWGLPADNLELYLLGAVKWVSPELGARYDDLFDTVQKKDLKGLEGKVLEDRIGRVMGGREVDISDETAKALAVLYSEGFTDVIPSATPTSMSINKEERQLDVYQQQVFDNTWGDIVDGTIDDVVSSDIFRNAEPETQVKILNKLYDYATNKAKVALFDDYEDGIKETEKAEGRIKELKEVGLDMADFFNISGHYTYFNGLDDEYSTEEEQAIAFSRWINSEDFTSEQADMIKEEFPYFGMRRVSAGTYDDMIAAGYDDETALKISEAGISVSEVPMLLAIEKSGATVDEGISLIKGFDSLPAINGRKGAGDYQKAEYVVHSIKATTRDGVANQFEILKNIVSDTAYEKMTVAYENFNIWPEVYLEVYNEAEALAYKETGRTSITQKTATKALENTNYGTPRKAVLWQILTGGNIKNNPYNTPNAARETKEAILEAAEFFDKD